MLGWMLPALDKAAEGQKQVRVGAKYVLQVFEGELTRAHLWSANSSSIDGKGRFVASS